VENSPDKIHFFPFAAPFLMCVCVYANARQAKEKSHSMKDEEQKKSIRFSNEKEKRTSNPCRDVM
jgi:hypothetical protein